MHKVFQLACLLEWSNILLQAQDNNLLQQNFWILIFGMQMMNDQFYEGYE